MVYIWFWWDSGAHDPLSKCRQVLVAAFGLGGEEGRGAQANPATQHQEHQLWLGAGAGPAGWSESFERVVFWTLKKILLCVWVGGGGGGGKGGRAGRGEQGGRARLPKQDVPKHKTTPETPVAKPPQVRDATRSS